MSQGDCVGFDRLSQRFASGLNNAVASSFGQEYRNINSKNWERFSQRAKRVMSLAQEEAERLRHNYVGSEHFLIGLLREETGVGAHVLSDVGLEIERLQQMAKRILGTGTRSPFTKLELAPNAKDLLELAVDEGRRMGNHTIQTEHLLLGLARQNDQTVVDILKNFGITTEQIRRHTRRLLKGIEIQNKPTPSQPREKDLPHFPQMIKENKMNLKIDSLFAKWYKKDSPGCALMVIKDGKVEYLRGYGQANLENQIQIKGTTIFDIASTSKQFTALSILLLARQGQLTLEDEVQQTIPELGVYDWPIRIRHLIHHTSGLRDYLALMALADMPFENHYANAEILDLICRQRELNFEPGSDYLYSNSGYYLLGVIVERVSGQSLRDFAHTHIFEPLGMHHTFFYDNHREIVPNRAFSYSKNRDDKYQLEQCLMDVVGDGGIYTDIADLAFWDQNFYHNRVGGYGDDLITEMTTVGTLNNGEPIEYGCGLIISKYRGYQTVSHGGSWVAFRSEMLRFPTEKLTVICLANTNEINPTALAKEVADLYLPASSKIPMPESETRMDELVLKLADLSRHVGFYQNRSSNIIWEIRMDEADNLVAAVSNTQFTLHPISADLFEINEPLLNAMIQFDRKTAELIVQDQKPVKLDQIEVRKVPESHFEQYIGTFHSDELNRTYHLDVKNEALSLSAGYRPDSALTPIHPDLWISGALTLTMVRDEAGQIIGFDAGNGRVKGIRFHNII